MKKSTVAKRMTSLALAVVLMQSGFSLNSYASDSPLDWEDTPEISIDFEETYLDTKGNTYYGNTAENWSSESNGRGSKTEAVTEADGNHAVRLTYDNENGNENYKANAVLNLYNPSTKSKFVGSEGTTYVISFDYKVEETDGQELQFFIAPSNRELGYPFSGTNAFSATDMGPMAVIPNNTTEFTAASDIIREKTDGWVRTSVRYTAQSAVNGHAAYPILLLQTNNKATSSSTTENYASVLIDNIEIKRPKRALVTCCQYDGTDRSFYIQEDTRFSELQIPTRRGYLFEGWYLDSDYTTEADDGELVGNYRTFYAKWFGNGELMTPYRITDSFSADIKRIGSCNLEQSRLNAVSYVQNSLLQVPGSTSDWSAFGSYVFSSDNTVTDGDETFVIDDIAVNPAADTVLFYTELPNFEKVGAAWGLAFGTNGIVLYQNGSAALDLGAANCFEYCMDNTWIRSTISSDGVFEGLPSGYKGYVRLDLSTMQYQSEVQFDREYKVNRIELRFNALGGEGGNAILGELLYFPKEKSESTVMQLDGLYYNLSKASEAVIVNEYSVKSENGSRFSTRYAGTVGQVTATYAENAENAAFWSRDPVAITALSGKAETTKGYMTTYVNDEADITMQPGVDTVMFYVEMPKYSQSNTSAGLKLLDMTLRQQERTATLSFSNSLYKYASMEDASWKIARAGADGDLYDIPSEFKGYIAFDVKSFKNINNLKAVIDFSDLYTVTKFEIGFNHIGGENGNLIIGGVYAVEEDSTTPFLKNGITSEKRCFKVLAGDLDCDGTYGTEDIVLIRQKLAGLSVDLDPAETLRANNLSSITLVEARQVVAGLKKADISVDTDNGAVYNEIFTADTISENTPKVYDAVHITDYAAKIEADTSLNSRDKAVSFANEINGNKVGDFEKIGIDKMCHVSTFLYHGGNIYVSYYANTVSAAEDPTYQVARFAYAPENNTDDKVILDIMQVGDNLYGHKVTGVYDTILMQKEDEPDNIYILWTASINGKYYRLYRIFDSKTETLGEIGVNRFKVGDVTNDFSSSGIVNALTANNVGYKQFFSDIGIMQKLSTRVENGVTYYYTGAYSGNFTCIIKSKDLITWEYVAQPNEGADGTGFENETKWENAVYVLNDKVYYFVRQWDYTKDSTTGAESGSRYGILTCYDLITGQWAKPVLVGDCQSRSDFIYYNGGLYLFYAPTDRNHIGILKIGTDNIVETEVVLQADMRGSCFYPFVQYNSNGELCMSYTVNRQHIRLASFTLSRYVDE